MEKTTFLLLINNFNDLSASHLTGKILKLKKENQDKCICLVSDLLEYVELADHLGIIGIYETSGSDFLATQKAIKVLGILEDDTVIHYHLGLEKVC